MQFDIKIIKSQFARFGSGISSGTSMSSLSEWRRSTNWLLLLAYFLLLIIGGIAFGAVQFFAVESAGTSEIPKAEGVPQNTINKSIVREALEVLTERQARYNALRERSPDITNPFE